MSFARGAALSDDSTAMTETINTYGRVWKHTPPSLWANPRHLHRTPEPHLRTMSHHNSVITTPRFHEKLGKLKSQLIESAKQTPSHYVPLGEVERILNENALDSLIKYCEPPEGRSTPEARGKAVRRLLERQPEDDLAAYRFLRVFATLIRCANIAYIVDAIRYFLYAKIDSDGNLDSELSSFWMPPEDDSPERGEDDFYNNIGIRQDGFYDTFFERKKSFCALVLKEGARHEIPEEIMVPFSIHEEDFLGHGGAGRVFKVRIGKRHWVNKRLSNSADLPLAIKRFKAPTDERSKERFENEFQNLMKLKSATITCENVMLPLASLIHGTQRYLIYDLADTDFEAYMWNRKPTYVFNTNKTKSVLKNGTDLVGALKWIHQYKPYHSLWHGDIRPQNILILSDGFREIWKLADFDRSHAKASRSESMTGYTPEPKDNQSYNAPEGRHGRRADVWSMACMITLILSWVADGADGNVEFLNKRNRNDPEVLDVFYNTDNPDAPVILSPMVDEWLDHLCDEATKKANEENAKQEKTEDLMWYPVYIKSVIDDLKKKIFVPFGRREFADDFYNFMYESFSRIPNTEIMETEPVKESDDQNAPSVEYERRLWAESRAQPAKVAVPPMISDNKQTSRESPRPSVSSGRTIGQEILSPATTGDSYHTINSKQCAPLCSAISSGPPPPNMSEFIPELNKTCSKCGDVPLHKAIRLGSRDWMEALMATEGIDLEVMCRKGGNCTPLMRCCVEEDRIWAAKLLLEKGCQRKFDKKSISSRQVKKELKKYM